MTETLSRQQRRAQARAAQKLNRPHVQMCHKQVREVAVAAANEFFEERMRKNNKLYDAYKKQNPGMDATQLEMHFVESNWARFIPFARATLTQLLTRPDIDDSVKLDIVDVLEKDMSLQRMGNVQLAGGINAPGD